MEDAQLWNQRKTQGSERCGTGVVEVTGGWEFELQTMASIDIFNFMVFDTLRYAYVFVYLSF